VSSISLARKFFPIKTLASASLLVSAHLAWAGAQIEEPLSASVRAALYKAVADTPVTKTYFESKHHEDTWLGELSRRLVRKIPDAETRLDFLRTVHYEAVRAGLDPELVMGLVQVESNFRKYAVSPVGARGFMQVMPFWTKAIGTKDHNLFHLRLNLRYGCTILRHYLDREKGDYFRALGRYNGSLGQAEYPNLVLAAWKNNWTVKTRRADTVASSNRS
jgi:soluble lytic murein transglycosylase-like protein